MNFRYVFVAALSLVSTIGLHGAVPPTPAPANPALSSFLASHRLIKAERLQLHKVLLQVQARLKALLRDVLVAQHAGDTQQEQLTKDLKFVAVALSLVEQIADGFNNGLLSKYPEVEYQFINVCNVLDASQPIELYQLREQQRRLTKFNKFIVDFGVEHRDHLMHVPLPSKDQNDYAEHNDQALLNKMVMFINLCSSHVLQEHFFPIDALDRVIDYVWERPREFASEHPTLVIAAGVAVAAGVGYWLYQRNHKQTFPALKAEPCKGIGLINGAVRCPLIAVNQSLFQTLSQGDLQHLRDELKKPSLTQDALDATEERVRVLNQSGRSVADIQASRPEKIALEKTLQREGSRPVVQAFVDLANKIEQKQVGSVDPQRFYNAVTKRYYAGSCEQRDAHEIMNFLLDDLRAWDITSFNVPVSSVVTCHDHHNHPSEGVYSSLEIPFVQGNLEASLGAFFAPDTLTGSNQYHCSNCNKKVDGAKQLHIEQWPNILVVSTAKFDAQGQKIEAPVSFPLELQAAKIGCSDVKSAVPGYDLVAVVNHAGDEKTGHYTTIARDLKGDGQWKLFDDSNVCAVQNINEIAHGGGCHFSSYGYDRTFTPYIFFYQKRHDQQPAAAAVPAHVAVPPASAASTQP